MSGSGAYLMQDTGAGSSSAATQALPQGAATQAAQATQVQGAEGEASPVSTMYDGQGQIAQVLPLLPKDSAVR